MINIAFPFAFDGRGGIALASDDRHVRDLIEQLLFTNPGERVNRADFGCGLLQMVFQPNSDELAAALQYTVQASLQQWLGDLLQFESVEVSSAESTLEVTVSYVVRTTQERQVAQFTRGT